MRKSQDKKTDVTEITRIIEEDNKKYLVDGETGEVFEILRDISSSGKERQWKKHKEESLTVSECYLSLFRKENLEYWLKKSLRLRSCGSYLTFDVYSDGMMKVKHADSCRVRLCPLCSWRRSVKIYAHTRKILESMQKEDKYEYLLLTLTIKNTTAENLNKTLDNLMKAWDKLKRYSKFEKAVKGWYRGLEVTHNINKKSKSYDTYHPHYHCIIVVNKSYFKKDDYIKQSDWLSMWRKATRDNSITQVDIRKVKPKIGNDITGAICEVTKYTVKNEDYIVPKNWQLTLDSVKTLDRALKNRRLVAFGGVMKEWHKKLNLDDEIDGNLMDTNENDSKAVEVTYFWNVSYQQYLKKS